MTKHEQVEQWSRESFELESTEAHRLLTHYYGHKLYKDEMHQLLDTVDRLMARAMGNAVSTLMASAAQREYSRITTEIHNKKDA